MMNKNLFSRHWELLLILIIGFLLRFFVVLHQGEMFDEYPVAGVGKIYWGALKNLNFSQEIWYINYEHPPVAKIIYGFPAIVQERLPIINKTFDLDFHPEKRYFLARVVSILLGLLSIASLYFVANTWYNKRVAVTSAFFLALMPHFIAHNAVAGIETPQVLVSIFVVYFYVNGLVNKSPKYIYYSAICFGLFFLTKFSAIFYLFFYLTGVLYLHVIGKVIIRRDFIVTLLKAGFISLAVIYFMWPWLWPNPLNLFRSLGYFDNSSSGEYFMGKTEQPPFYYYFVYAAATTPPVILVFVALALIKLRKNVMIALTVLWLVTPFTISLLGLKKDGIRYVITFLPPLSLLAAVGFNRILTELKSTKIKYFIVMISFFSILWSLIKFMPYYLDYYNILIGGTETVYSQHLLDYAWWGEGIKESVLYVNKNYGNKSVYPIFTPSHGTPLFKSELIVLDSKEVQELNRKPDLILIGENYFYYKKVPDIINGYRLVKTFNVNDTPLVRLYEPSN